jgi:hypothetical protein
LHNWGYAEVATPTIVFYTPVLMRAEASAFAAARNVHDVRRSGCLTSLPKSPATFGYTCQQNESRIPDAASAAGTWVRTSLALLAALAGRPEFSRPWDLCCRNAMLLRGADPPHAWQHLPTHDRLVGAGRRIACPWSVAQRSDGICEASCESGGRTCGRKETPENAPGFLSMSSGEI